MSEKVTLVTSGLAPSSDGNAGTDFVHGAGSANTLDLATSRAVDAMRSNAVKMGADGVNHVRVNPPVFVNGSFHVVAYGTTYKKN